MNKRQKKKFVKRGCVYKYRHFKMAKKRFVRLMKVANDMKLRVTDGMKLEIWRSIVNLVRHPNIVRAYQHLRYARHLDPSIEEIPEVPEWEVEPKYDKA